MNTAHFCLVCSGSLNGGQRCPICSYDHAAADARDPARISNAREAFKAGTLRYAPESRVTLKDKMGPWLGLGLGAIFFIFWCAMCSGRFHW